MTQHLTELLQSTINKMFSKVIFIFNCTIIIKVTFILI